MFVDNNPIEETFGTTSIFTAQVGLDFKVGTQDVHIDITRAGMFGGFTYSLMLAGEKLAEATEGIDAQGR